MKVLVINGSPRKVVCDAFCNEVLAQGKEYGHVVNVVNLVDYNIAFCQGCKSCEKKGKCVLKDDYTEKLDALLREADLVVFATPNYFANVSGLMKNYMDRTYNAYSHMNNKDTHYSVFISAESDYYGCMNVYERVKEYADLMGMSEKAEPYFQMNTKDTFTVDDKLKSYVTELLMKTIYVDVDSVDTDEALAEMEDID